MSILDDNWNFFINDNIEIENDYFKEFETEMNTLTKNLLKILESSFLINNLLRQSNLNPSYDDELKLLSEGNKVLRQEIDLKFKNLALQQDQYEHFKKDQKLLSHEIKETHKAFLMAKKYYKKFLKFYFTIESTVNNIQVVFVQFFTEVKRDSDNYSARLMRNTKTSQYELQSINPNLKSFKELQKKLLETNDVPGMLCCIRQAFLNMKNKN